MTENNYELLIAAIDRLAENAEQLGIRIDKEARARALKLRALMLMSLILIVAVGAVGSLTYQTRVVQKEGASRGNLIKDCVSVSGECYKKAVAFQKARDTALLKETNDIAVQVGRCAVVSTSLIEYDQCTAAARP